MSTSGETAPIWEVETPVLRRPSAALESLEKKREFVHVHVLVNCSCG